MTFQALLQHFHISCQHGDRDQAQACLELLQAQVPELPETRFMAGYFACLEERWQEARQILRPLSQDHPQFWQAWFHLARAEGGCGNYFASWQALEQAIRVHPQEWILWKHLLRAQYVCGESQRLLASSQYLLQRGAQLFTLPAMQAHFQNYQAELAAMAIVSIFHLDPMANMAQLTRDYARRYLPPVRPLKRMVDTQPERRLRVGVLSYEWGNAAIEHVYLKMFTYLIKKVDLIAYLDLNSLTDPRLEACFSNWHSIQELDNEATYQLMQTDTLDILLDLTGYFNPRRLALLALKPAPIVVAAGTNPPFVSGLSSINAVLSDRHLLPPGSSDETLFYLDCFSQWNPPQPELPLAAFREGPARILGCAAALAKITDPQLSLWGQILEHLPQVQLWLKQEYFSEPALQDLFRYRFRQQGGDIQRLRFVDNQEQNDLFSFFRQVDIVLDTFPYGGALSTLDAFYLGVPAVGRAGGRRISNSIYRVLGLESLLTDSDSAYVERVCELAQDSQQRQTYHQCLRPALLGSPNCQPEQRAQQIYQHFRQLWRDFCQSAKTSEGKIS